MIDLSITKDAEWIKQRELLWKPIGKSLSEGFRKKEVEKIHHYFMAGILREGEELSDGAKFDWFPIQSPEAWDYILEHLFDTKEAVKNFEKIFYFQFGDLSHRALNEAQELALWDYFAGDTFQSVVTSRVPVGKEKKIASFEVDYEKVAAEFNLNVRGWLEGGYANNPKWKQRFNYFLTMLPHMEHLKFVDLASDGEFDVRVEYLVHNIFRIICNPPYGESISIDSEGMMLRQEFTSKTIKKLDAANMPPVMKFLWEETKAKHGV
jgi:hypothetical protein